MPSFYEFFAGGGMARAGLGPAWTCLFANDIDSRKASSYKENWGGGELVAEDVRLLSTNHLPGHADVAWASFPCQDLSLAGMGAGLKGSRSGTFWAFWSLIKDLGEEGRMPRIVVLENVCGALTSHGGADFRSIVDALTSEGYRCGALVIDAALFVPQSRPRLFVIGIRSDIDISATLSTETAEAPFHTSALKQAYSALSPSVRDHWIWWKLTPPCLRPQSFAQIIEDTPSGIRWHHENETRALLALMSPLHLAKVERAQQAGSVVVGSLYKRTRRNASGVRAQRAEVRFDGLVGCLRTPGGGSSRQTILVVQRDKVRSRLLSPRETARLMGLSEQYILPERYSDACHLTGDGVVVPVVRYLAENLLEPLIRRARVVDNAA